MNNEEKIKEATITSKLNLGINRIIIVPIPEYIDTIVPIRYVLYYNTDFRIPMIYHIIYYNHKTKGVDWLFEYKSYMRKSVYLMKYF